MAGQFRVRVRLGRLAPVLLSEDSGGQLDRDVTCSSSSMMIRLNNARLEDAVFSRFALAVEIAEVSRWEATFRVDRRCHGVSNYNHQMVAQRSVTNNWLLLVLVSVVSFGGALLYLWIDEPASPIFLVYFVVNASLIAATAFWWFGEHPPAIASPAWMYVAAVILLIFSGTVLGMLPGTRGIASWLTIGACFALYGRLERSVAITSAGLVTLVVSTLVYVAEPVQLGLILEIITGVVFASAAIALKLSPEEPDVAGD